MYIETKIKLRPFQTPNYVLSDDQRIKTSIEIPKFKLSELDEQSLSMLCAQFRKDIFKKAGKEDPEMRNK